MVRGQHLSQIKARLLWLAENVISPIKTQHATTGTSAATYKVLEPHYACIKEALKLPRAFSRLEDFTNTFNYRTEREAEIFQVKVYGLIRLN